MWAVFLFIDCFPFIFVVRSLHSPSSRMTWISTIWNWSNFVVWRNDLMIFEFKTNPRIFNIFCIEFCSWIFVLKKSFWIASTRNRWASNIYFIFNVWIFSEIIKNTIKSLIVWIWKYFWILIWFLFWIYSFLPILISWSNLWDNKSHIVCVVSFISYIVRNSLIVDISILRKSAYS